MYGLCFSGICKFFDSGCSSEFLDWTIDRHSGFVAISFKIFCFNVLSVATCLNSGSSKNHIRWEKITYSLDPDPINARIARVRNKHN